MAVYYKFKSAKDFDSIAIDGHFISVGYLKEKIFESKHLGRGTDFDLMVSNAQTNEEYPDEDALIPKNTSVLVRRVPGKPRMPIVTDGEETKALENKVEDSQPVKSSLSAPNEPGMTFPGETEWDEFGNDLYAIPDVLPAQSSNPVQDASLPNRADEDSKIKALIDTSAFDWQVQDGFGAGRGFGRGMGGRMMPGRGFGRGMLERKTPPPGYICHRCKVPGHYIQHCPTNGDPNYDIKKTKPPTGIPRSMLVPTPDGSYALPSGAAAVLKPNEAAFEKEIERLPTTRTVIDVPPELRCPLCKEVMQDAVLTSKCCFKSFCDKCIRNQIISKSACVCGATNVLADDLLPNKTVRETINRFLESNNNSAENAGSMLQIQDMESARPTPCKVPSPTLSATFKGEQRLIKPAEPKAPATTLSASSRGEQLAPTQGGNMIITGTTNGAKDAYPPERVAKTVEASEATFESVAVKEPVSQGSAPRAEEEVQQNPSTSEPGKKKKKKKARVPTNDVLWRPPQDIPADNYMMPFPPSYDPYWGNMQPGMDGFMNPFGCPMPYMGYVPGPFDVPMNTMLPQDPFGGQGYMMPAIPPQRDFPDYPMGSNLAPPIMNRAEFEARKANLMRRHGHEGHVGRIGSEDQYSGRDVNGGVQSMKTRNRISQTGSPDRLHHRAERESSPDRSRFHRVERESSMDKYHHHHREKREGSLERSHHHHRDKREESLDGSHRHHHGHRSHRHREREISPERSHHHYYHEREISPERSRHHRHQRHTESPVRDPSEVVRHARRRSEHDNPTPEEEDLLKSAKKRRTPEEAAPAAVKEMEADKKHKASVFSRISFPVGGSKKVSSENGSKASSRNGHRDDRIVGGSSVLCVEDEDSSSSDDEERHFKRRPSRYEPPVEWEKDLPPSRSSKEGGHRHR